MQFQDKSGNNLSESKFLILVTMEAEVSIVCNVSKRSSESEFFPAHTAIIVCGHNIVGFGEKGVQRLS